MKMKNGQSLKDLYTEAEYNRITHYFLDSLEMPITLFAQIKPVFLTSLLYPKMMPCKTVDGIEQELMILAKQKKMKNQSPLYKVSTATPNNTHLLPPINMQSTYKFVNEYTGTCAAVRNQVSTVLRCSIMHTVHCFNH